MKKLFWAICIMGLLAASPVTAAEVKQVCHDKVVKGKTTKVCKKIKIHKKLTGTKVPTKK